MELAMSTRPERPPAPTTSFALPTAVALQGTLLLKLNIVPAAKGEIFSKFSPSITSKTVKGRFRAEVIH